MQAKSTTSSWIGLVLSFCALPALIWVSLYGHPALGFSGLIVEQQAAQQSLALNETKNPAIPENPVSATDSPTDSPTDTDQVAAVQVPSGERPAEADAKDALKESRGNETAPEVADNNSTTATNEDSSVPAVMPSSNQESLAQVDKTPPADDNLAKTATGKTALEAQATLAATIEAQKKSQSSALEKAGERAREMARENKLQLAASEKAEELAKAQVSRQSKALSDAGSRARRMAQEHKAELLAAETVRQQRTKERAVATSAQRQMAQKVMQENALLEAGSRARKMAADYKAQQLAANKVAEEKAASLQKEQAELQQQALLDAGNKARQLIKERKSAEQQALALKQVREKQQKQALIQAGKRVRELETEARAAKLAEQQNQALVAAGNKARELAKEARAAKVAEQQNQALVAAGNKARELAKEAQAAKVAEQQNQALVAAGNKAREMAAEAEAAKLARQDLNNQAASLVVELNTDKVSISAVMTADEVAESVLDKLVALLSFVPVTENISFYETTRGGEQLLESLDLLVNELAANDVTLADAVLTLNLTENNISVAGQLATVEDAEALHSLLESVFTERDLVIRLKGMQASDNTGDKAAIATNPEAATGQTPDQQTPDQQTPDQQTPDQQTADSTDKAETPAEITFEALRDRELNQLALQAENLKFESGEWVVSQPLRKPLDLIFETLFLYSEATVRLTIYSDDSDDKVMNKFVSQQRARSIRRYLTDRGLEPGRITAVGAGHPEGKPVAEIEVKIKEK